MFTLKDEYFDWYKARMASINHNLSWSSLKNEFI